MYEIVYFDLKSKVKFAIYTDASWEIGIEKCQQT